MHGRGEERQSCSKKGEKIMVGKTQDGSAEVRS